MNIVQKETSAFAPCNIIKTQLLVTETAGSTSISSNFGVNLTRYDDVVGHFDILLSGLNIDETSVVGGPDTALLDISDFPVIRRINSGTQGAEINVFNGTTTTDNFPIVFQKISNQPVFSSPFTLDVGSYAKYSYDIVTALMTASPNNKWLTGANLENLTTRTNLATFPHQALSGIEVRQGNGGKSIAITKRHAVISAHYGGMNSSKIGQKLTWRNPINGTLIERTIIEVLDGLDRNNPDFGIDLAMFLLNEDLPESITPMKIAGQWAGHPVINDATKFFSYYRDFCGITVWSRDGEWTPSMIFSTGVIVIPVQYYYLPAGRGYGAWTIQSQYRYCDMVPSFSSNSSFGPYTYGMTEFDYQNQNSRFYHNRLGGDSGSPTLIPGAGGTWGLAGMETSNSPTKVGFDIFINLIDAKAVSNSVLGSPTGYTTVEIVNPMI